LKTVAIVQARYGSSRLRGKVLEDVAGRPLLVRVLERVARSRLIDEIVVATTIAAEDEQVAAVASKWGAETFRGSDDDVLDRFRAAVAAAAAGTVVRITADDPLKDPGVIDLVGAELRADRQLDYVSNTLEPTWPEGVDVEWFTAAALESAWRQARRPSEREHVTPYIWQHPERFHVRNVRRDPDLSELRWTVDHADDLDFVRAVYDRLGDGDFRTDDILELLEREPELQTINAGHRRAEGYNRSLARDETVPGTVRRGPPDGP
jgi:spore coat polysaccharide biosynthesis protein SpsF